MHRTLPALALAFLAAGAACSRNNNATTDTTLNTDLSLAAQQRGAVPDSLNPNELNPAATPAAGVAAPARTASTGTVHHTSSERTYHRSSSGSSGHVYSSGGTVTTSSGHVVKHTQRDAAIGAAAGAVLGATTSRNKIKGGLIGAAVGGILGGVIGNNVDKKKVP